MTARINRAGSLGAELLASMRRLADEVRGPEAFLFLDRLARLETFDPSELGAAGIADVVEQARSLRGAAAQVLGTAAGTSIDVQDLLERAYRLASDQGEDAAAFAMTALGVAAVAPSLPSGDRERVAEACQELASIVMAHPGRFSDAAEVGRDRAVAERPSRMPEPARLLIHALRSAPELEARDEDRASQPAPARARAAWAELLLRQTKGEAPNSGRFTLLSSVRDAVQEFLGSFRGPALAMAATGSAVPDYMELGRHLGGVFLLVGDTGRLSIEWKRLGSGLNPGPELWRSTGSGWQRLPSSPVTGGLSWLLDEPAHGAALEARQGQQVFAFDLP